MWHTKSHKCKNFEHTDYQQVGNIVRAGADSSTLSRT